MANRGHRIQFGEKLSPEEWKSRFGPYELSVPGLSDFYAASWYKFPLSLVPNDGHRWYLRVSSRDAYKYVTVVMPLSDGQWQEQAMPYYGNGRYDTNPYLDFIFLVPDNIDSSRPCFVRVDLKMPPQRMDLVSGQVLHSSDNRRRAIHTASLACVLFF